MKRSLGVALVAALLVLQTAGRADNRVQINLNAGWKFTKGDISGAEASTFGDGTWSSVGLPYSASIPFFIDDSMYSGYTWYRKHLTVGAQYSGEKVSVDFEAAFDHAWVYCNGQLIGEHKGGYTGFAYDITPFISLGQDNVIAVRLCNLWDAAIPPRTGDAWFHNGIYRDVSLVITNPLHVARLGVFASTPSVSASHASVNIKTEVLNESAASKTCTVVSTIRDSNNVTVTSVSTTLAIAAGRTDTVSQDTGIANPRLWSPSAPYRYNVLTQVYDNGVLVDSYTTFFGVRWYTATAANGFSLNGQHLYLRGFDVHQDRAGWADAAVNYDFYRDLKMLKDAGANCVRCSHYPHDMAFYEACDKLGILAFAELHFWGRGGFAGGGERSDWYAETYPTVDAPRPAFDSTLTANFRDMVREARNHPAVFAWSLGNETDMQVPAAIVTYEKALWTSLYAIAHQMDSSRFVSCGEVYFALNSNIIDLDGMNGGEPLPAVQQAKPVLTTEYGSCVRDRPGIYTGCSEPTVYAWRCGALRWLAFHHGTHCQGNGGNWAHMGVIDYNRLPLRDYYWVRNNWLGTSPPAWPDSGTAAKLSITADKTTILDDGTDDCQLIITVKDAGNTAINNNVSATLTITDGPGILPTGKSWSFTTPDGQQAIEMRAYSAGTTTITASSGALTAGTITITSQDPAPIVGILDGRTNGGTVSATAPVLAAAQAVSDASGSVRVSFVLSKAACCRVTMFDIYGRTIRQVESGIAQPGSHTMVFTGSGRQRGRLSSGVYFLSLQTGGEAKTMSVQVVK